MKPKNSLRNFLALAGCSLLAISYAHAATLYWDSNGTGTAGAGDTPTGTWGTDVFWTTDSTGANVGAPVLTATTTSADDLFFSAGTDAVNPYAISLDSATQNARLVTFKDGTVTLSAGTLSLGNLGGLTVTTDTVTGATISTGLTISGSQTFNVADSRTLNLNTGTFTRNAGATLNVASTGTVTTTMTNLDSASLVNGIVGPWASHGTGASTRYATIDGSNNIVGLTGTAAATAAGVTDNTGTFNYDVAAVGTLGGGANINTLRYTGAAGTIAGALTTRGIMNVSGNALTFSGAVTGVGELVVNTANGNVSFNAATAAGSYGLVKDGPGRLNLANADTTYSGNVTVNGGILFYGDTPARLTSGNITLNGGVIEQRWTGAFTKTQGSGAGQIQILGGESGFSMNGNQTYTLNIGAITWGSATFNPSKFVLQTSASQGNSAITMPTASTFNLGGETRTILVNSGVTGNASATIQGVISNGGLIKEGAGRLVLSGANTFNGQLAVENGTLSIGSINNASANGTLGNSALAVILGSSGNTGTLLYTGGINSSTKAFTLATGGTGGFNVSNAATTLTLSAQVDGSGALTKNGAGTLALSGTNTYAGTTTVNAGTLKFANEASLYNGTPASWTAANLNLKSGTTLQLNVDSAGSAGFTSANLSTLLGNISVANTAAQGMHGGTTLALDTSTATGATFTQGNAITNSTGAFGGVINLTKLGAGTLVLDKANTYTGLTTISAGTIQLSASGVILHPIINNGTLLVDKAAIVGTDFPANIIGSGSVAVNTGGTVTISSATALQNIALNTAGGGNFILSGVSTPVFGGLTGATGDLATVISSGYSGVTNLTLSPQSGTFTYGGVIADGAAGMDVTKTGAGTQILQGANTYTGATFLNAGTLTLSGAGSILSSAITFNGGGLNLINTAAETGSGRVSDSAGITSNGGTLTYTNTSGANVYAETIGSVALTSGQLNFNLATNQASSGSQTLTLSGLTQSGSGAATFSAATTGPNATKNRILVSGATQTPSGQIIGPWATTGTAANNQNDYAVYDADGYIVPANIAASAETDWTTSTDAYTLSTPAKAATALTDTRNIAALKASSTATVTTSNISNPGGGTVFAISSGHSFNVGDPVALSSFSGDVQNLNVGRVYYVESVTGTSFRLAETPGGSAIVSSTTNRTVQFTGGLKLDDGINLGTTGILNSGNAPLAIGRTAAGGHITLPTAGAGNLHITTGLSPVTGANSGLNGRISIEAPIVDNGGALTLVKNGAGVLRLQGTNTYTGGTVINSGTVIFTDNSNFGSAATPITFNGSGALSFGPNSSWAFASGGTVPLSRPIELNNGAIAGIYHNSPNTTMNISGAITGDGGVISGRDPVVTFNGGPGTININFTSTGNTFTGPLTISNAAATFNSLADGSGSMILNSNFTYGSGAIANLSIPSRLVDVRANATITNSAGSTRTMTLGDISTTTAGAKTLTLSNTNTNGAGFVTGNITNGAGTIGITKTGNGTFTLSGTNTYSGRTTLAQANPAVGGITFQGMQSLSENTELYQRHGGGAGGHGTWKFLDDSATPASRSGVDVTHSQRNAAQNTLSIFVGNNSTANGGTSASTQTGSTIQLGNLNFQQEVTGASNGARLNLTGANDYGLQLGNLNVELQAAYTGSWNVRLAAISAGLTVGGNVQQAAGSLGTTNLQLDGAVNGNVISGNILDSADVTPQALAVTKEGVNSWTLSGANTYSGTTTVSAGTLLVNGDQSSASGTVSVSANATLGGTGTIGGNTTIAANGRLEFDISTNDASHNKLDLAATRTLTFSAASVLTITSPGGATPGTYTLATAPGGISGDAPATLNLPIDWVATVDIVGNDLVLDVTETGSASPYDTWAAGFLPGADVSDPTLDFDSDGLTNLQEFAFGTDPTVNFAGSIEWVAAGAVTTPGSPVAVNIAGPGDPVDFRAVFGRRKDWLAAGLTYTVQFSAGLDVWVNSAATPTVLTDDINSDIDAVSVPYPLLIPTTQGFEKPRFFRVGVELAP